MARILYVDETEEWHDTVRRALGGHRVDPACSTGDAVARLAGPAYDLAIVDLDLLPDLGTLGAELLDVLRARHPETRRIGIVAGPLPDASRAAVLDRHRLDDVLVKAGLTDARLAGAVQRSLDRPVTPDADARRAELRRRYETWRACFHVDAEEVGRRIEAAVTIRDTLLAADAFERVRTRWPGPG